MILHIKQRGYWKNISNQRAFMDALAKKLNIKYQEEWYDLTHGIMKKHGGTGLLDRYKNSPSKLLTTVYPEYPVYLIYIVLFLCDTNGISPNLQTYLVAIGIN